jgi:hypothetical protein
VFVSPQVALSSFSSFAFFVFFAAKICTFKSLELPSRTIPMLRCLLLNAVFLCLAATTFAAEPTAEPKILRAGIIGLDTSHVAAFTKTLNAEKPKPDAAGVRVVAAWPGGSADIPSSINRVPGFTSELKKLGVEIVDSIDDLVSKVDVVMIESLDGRVHLEQLRPVLKAKKPVYIDKPLAANLPDVLRIYDEAKAAGVPIFSSSSLRFGKATLAARAGDLGKITHCVGSSPVNIEPHHPDLYWYGIHGCESLYTVLGKGCVAVQRGTTADGKIEVTGEWSEGQIGIFREGKGYSGHAKGSKGESDIGAYEGYDPLVFEIVKFFKTGTPPVTAEETIEIYTFMEAADESKRQNGAKVLLADVLKKARAEVDAKK